MKPLGFVITAAMSLSFTAMAHPGHSTVFVGEGQWRSSAGDEGDYKVTKTEVCLEGGDKQLTTALVFADDKPAMNWVLRFHKEPNQLWTVRNSADVHIGWGYCYAARGGKACHMELTPHEGTHVEQTAHITHGLVYSIGSMTQADHTISTWKDQAHRVGHDGTAPAPDLAADTFM